MCRSISEHKNSFYIFKWLRCVCIYIHIHIYIYIYIYIYQRQLWRARAHTHTHTLKPAPLHHLSLSPRWLPLSIRTEHQCSKPCWTHPSLPESHILGIYLVCLIIVLSSSDSPGLCFQLCCRGGQEMSYFCWFSPAALSFAISFSTLLGRRFQESASSGVQQGSGSHH